jgi:hypothetical protein
MRVQRGDIFLANLDPIVGVEQAGTRPVLVVQCDLANERIPTVTVVPLTSNLRAGRFLFTVTVPATESGLAADSGSCLPHAHHRQSAIDPLHGAPGLLDHVQGRRSHVPSPWSADPVTGNPLL